MNKHDAQPAEIAPSPPKKHNLGAKIGIASTLGVIVGGKISMIGLIPDLNNLFPKDMSFGAKFKKVFSKDILPLFGQAIQQEVKKGHHPAIAYVLATRWSGIMFMITGGALAVLGWKGAERIEKSSDIWEHPIKSTKIILGLESPNNWPDKSSDTIAGKHTAAIVAERAAPSEIYAER